MGFITVNDRVIVIFVGLVLRRVGSHGSYGISIIQTRSFETNFAFTVYLHNIPAHTLVTRHPHVLKMILVSLSLPSHAPANAYA